jgi:small subunit ribosomal protein S18
LADDREEGRESRRPSRKSYRFRRRKQCDFCAGKIKSIDYKDADMLRQYLTGVGKMKARRKTGVCARHQRRLALAIKRARQLALLPYSVEHVRGS